MRVFHFPSMERKGMMPSQRLMVQILVLYTLFLVNEVLPKMQIKIYLFANLWLPKGKWGGGRDKLGVWD